MIVVIDAPVPWLPSAIQPTSHARLIHIAHDPLYADYPFRGFQMDLAIAGDPGAAIVLLRDALVTKLRNRQAAVDQRRRKIADMRRRIDEERAAFLVKASSMQPIHPAWVAHALNQVKAADAIIVEELGAAFAFLDLKQPGTFISFTSGGLGLGLGQALGAKLAAPQRQVIATVGDGSYMFGVPSAAHFVGRAENLPTLTMVLNNSQWGAVRRATLAMYPDGLAAKANSLPVVDLTPSPDYEKITEAFGGTGERIEDPQKLVPAIARALEQGRRRNASHAERDHTRAGSSVRRCGERAFSARTVAGGGPAKRARGSAVFKSASVPRVDHRRELGERHLDDADVLMFLCEAAAAADLVGAAIGREEEIHPLGRNAGHRPGPDDMFERAEPQAGLFHHFAPRAGFGIVAFEDPGRRFEMILQSGHKEKRRAQLAHQRRDAALRIKGEDGDGIAVILDLAADPAAVGQFHIGDGECAPSGINFLHIANARRH